MAAAPRRIGVVLSNLRAEGGPVLAADLCAVWRETGIEPVVFLLNDTHRDLEPRFRALGTPIEVLGVDSISPLRYPKLFVQMRAALARCPVDGLVSIPMGVHSAIFAAAAAVGVRHRVLHFGNYPWHWQAGFWKFKLLMRLGRRLTPHLACVTAHVRDGVRAHLGRVAGELHVVPNGVDLERFEAVARARAVAGRPLRPVGAPPTALMVGRLESGKDHAVLVEAIALLAERGRPMRLRLAGSGVLADSIRAQAERRGVAVLVELLGVRSDIPELLAEADLFVFSVKPEEGLGIALVEAMAAGVPAVATDVGACREALDGGACGLLAPPGDAAALANAIAETLDAPEATAARAARARARARAVYDRRAMARRYAALCGAA